MKKAIVLCMVDKPEYQKCEIESLSIGRLEVFKMLIVEILVLK